MREEWKNIKGYESFYQVSNFGNVRSLTRYVKSKNGAVKRIVGKKLKQSIGTNGYLSVSLSKDQIIKTFHVHRLVAMSFVQITDKTKTHVDHIDGNKLNNQATNLRWCNNKENHNYELAKKHNSSGQRASFKAQNALIQKHNANKKKVLCVETQTIYESQVDVAKVFNTSKQNVFHSIKTGGICKGFHFKYCEEM